MATQVQKIPTRGPNWTFYAYTAFAVLVMIAIYVGFHVAGLGR